VLHQLAVATARAETAELRLAALERDYGVARVGREGGREGGGARGPMQPLPLSHTRSYSCNEHDQRRFRDALAIGTHALKTHHKGHSAAQRHRQ
jgi:hypothetical protein